MCVDVRGAGTDANVTMTLMGDKGDTGERKLDSSANDFERGKVSPCNPKNWGRISYSYNLFSNLLIYQLLSYFIVSLASIL